MVLQAIGMVLMQVVMLQLMLFIFSSASPLKQAYADSWRKTGTVIAHLFQIQRGPDQWIGFAALGLMVYVALIAIALDVVGRFIH